MYTDGIWFKDEQGRTLILRGANLGGSSKVPYQPNGATYRREGFYDHRSVSFVGRPFPLEEADEHFRRLTAWGMYFLRFLITWEAVEHQGPGEYDEAYLDYVRSVIQKAAQYGIDVFIDPHQDVWSRWTGGDGAPGWTLEAVGMDISKLAATGAAITHQTHGDPFPRMIWPTNYNRLGAATMFTLFFAGNDFAPATRIEGIPVQEYLQSHYISAVRQVAERLADLPNVAGYDTLNEPGLGFVGVDDLAAAPLGPLLLGASPTPWQAILAGSGHSQEADVYQMGFQGPEVIGKEVFNPANEVLWKPGYECVWKQNGLWTDGDGAPKLLRPDHFATRHGESVDPIRDHLKPFIKRYAAAIREVDPDAILFVEGTPGGGHIPWDATDPPQVVNAAHWYDFIALLSKQFNPEFTVNIITRQPVTGADNVRQAYIDQLAAFNRISQESMSGIPTLIGEFGVPFDLDGKSSYRTADFSAQTTALDLYYNAMDANLLNCTIWNYTADNTNERGDLWNDEDLSIFSRDQIDSDSIHAGGRGIPAVARPYARKIAGQPLRMSFDLATRVFELEYRHDPNISAPTEIFLPGFQYPQGCVVEVSDGHYHLDLHANMVIVHPSNERSVHTVRVYPAH